MTIYYIRYKLPNNQFIQQKVLVATSADNAQEILLSSHPQATIYDCESRPKNLS